MCMPTWQVDHTPVNGFVGLSYFTLSASGWPHWAMGSMVEPYNATSPPMQTVQELCFVRDVSSLVPDVASIHLHFLVPLWHHCPISCGDGLLFHLLGYRQRWKIGWGRKQRRNGSKNLNFSLIKGRSKMSKPQSAVQFVMCSEKEEKETFMGDGFSSLVPFLSCRSPINREMKHKNSSVYLWLPYRECIFVCLHTA